MKRLRLFLFCLFLAHWCLIFNRAYDFSIWSIEAVRSAIRLMCCFCLYIFNFTVLGTALALL